MLVCKPWLTVADLPASRPGLSADQWTGVLVAASDLLYVLSGRQWAGAGCRAQFTYDGPACYGPLPRTGDALDVGGRATNTWSTSDEQGIRLPDRAGIAVETVTLPGGSVVAGPHDVRRGWLYRAGASWPAGTVVVYSYGLDPPEGGKTAAGRYAIELGKALCGDRTCGLPARVRSVVRQGVSIEVADPLTFLDKGRTGLTDVDGWLASINPTGARRRSGVWTPETAVRGRRAELTPLP